MFAFIVFLLFVNIIFTIVGMVCASCGLDKDDGLAAINMRMSTLKGDMERILAKESKKFTDELTHLREVNDQLHEELKAISKKLDELVVNKQLFKDQISKLVTSI